MIRIIFSYQIIIIIYGCLKPGKMSEKGKRRLRGLIKL